MPEMSGNFSQKVCLFFMPESSSIHEITGIIWFLEKGVTCKFSKYFTISRIVNHIRQVPKTRYQKTWVLVLRNQIIPFLHVCTQLNVVGGKSHTGPIGLTLNSWSGLPWQVQWLRVPTSTAEGVGLIPLRELWSWMLCDQNNNNELMTANFKWVPIPLRQSH